MTTETLTLTLTKSEQKQLREMGLNSKVYKQLTRKIYRSPKGYADYKETALEIATTYEACSEIGIKLNSWKTNRTMFQLINHHVVNNASSYWLDNNLFEAFLKSDIPKGVGDIKQVIKSGLLFLPEGLKSPDGSPVSWLAFAHLKKNEAVAAAQTLNVVIHDPESDSERICWGTILKDCVVYSGVFYPERMQSKDELIICKVEGNPETESIFIDSISALLTQTLIAAAIMPELLQSDKNSAYTAGFAKHNPKKDELKYLNPNWIGRGYKPRVITRPQSSGTHASPSTHWRRGHWRRVPTGPREEGNRKWNWIQPVLVNA